MERFSAATPPELGGTLVWCSWHWQYHPYGETCPACEAGEPQYSPSMDDIYHD
jgi:hypothetical protein